MSQYDQLSEEDLSKLIQELQDARRRKRGELPKSRLHDMLDPSSSDFMGTGMSMQEFMMVGEVERLTASYWRQDREEKSRRRDAMVALTVEYIKITAQTIQATLFAREAIVGIVNGDWRDVKTCRDMLTFEGEDVGHRDVYAPIFARFVELLDEVLAGVPKPKPEASDEVVAPN